MFSAAEFLPGLDQALVDRVVLIGRLRNDAPLDRLFEPGPLKHRRLEDRGRRVGIVFQQLCRSLSVEAEVEPAVEAGFVALPAFRDQRPECFGDLQPLEIFFVVDGAADELEAHRVDLARRRLDLRFDLFQREGVIAALVPVAGAVDGVEVEAAGIGGLLPIVALGADDALHVKWSAIRRHARGLHGHGHDRGNDESCRRIRPRSAGNRAGHRGQVSLSCPDRNRRGAPRPLSIRRRARQFPSRSTRRGASVSQCGPPWSAVCKSRRARMDQASQTR